MGATDFRDFVGLGFRSSRLLEGHTTKLNNTQCVILAFILRIYNIHSYLPIIIYFLERFHGNAVRYRVTLRGTDQPRRGGSRVPARLHSRTRVLFAGTALRDSWFRTLQVWLTLSFFLSVSFNLILWDMSRLLSNADSGVPCPRFGCKKFGTEVLSLHFRNY